MGKRHKHQGKHRNWAAAGSEAAIRLQARAVGLDLKVSRISQRAQHWRFCLLSNGHDVLHWWPSSQTAWSPATRWKGKTGSADAALKRACEFAEIGAAIPTAEIKRNPESIPVPVRKPQERPQQACQNAPTQPRPPLTVPAKPSPERKPAAFKVFGSTDCTLQGKSTGVVGLLRVQQAMKDASRMPLFVFERDETPRVWLYLDRLADQPGLDADQAEKLALALLAFVKEAKNEKAG